MEDISNEIVLKYVNGIIDTLREPFLVLASNLQIITANRSFYDTFKVDKKGTIGIKLPDLGNKQWNIPVLIHLIENILPEKKVVKDYEVEHNFETIGHRVMLLNASKLKVSKKIAAIIAADAESEWGDEGEEEELILLAIEDITVRRKDENLLKEISERKSSYVTDVSHEFRNPLAIITESMGMILNGFGGRINAEQQRMIEMAKRNADRLLRMITNILNVSTMESGNIKMNFEEINIISLVEVIIKNYEKKAGEKQLIIEKVISDNIGHIWGDKDKLEQVVVNLFNNAIKYTPDGGKITTKLLKKGEKIRFEIYNTGQGLSKEEIKKLFDKYERITAEKEEGTGLGLTIAKDIMKLHKGTIEVKSEIGQGCTFILIFPQDARI